MSFPKYPAYKESGVEWIGEIPEGWKLLPFKRIAVAHYGESLKSEEREDNGNIPVYGSNGIVGYHNHSNSCAPTIFIGRKGSVGALTWSVQAGFAIDTVYYVSINPTFDMRWLYWCLQTLHLNKLSQDTGVPGLSREILYERILALPSTPEQKAIASFLNRECTKIDALIAEQECLITLLQEKRQAVISHAVTKGLEPNVPMKESGIEWIGEVPQTYRIIRLSLLFNIISSGTTPTTDNENFYDGNIAWVTTGELKEKGISETTKNITELAFSHFPALRLYPPNTLLIAMYGATIGRLGWLEVAAATNQACCALADSRQVEMKFIFYTLLAAKQSLVLLSSGGGQPNINQDKIRSFKVPVPSLAEQKQIILHLDKSTSEIDDLINHANQNASLLKERRSALISAAVTGKIDVRKLVNPKDIAA